MSNSKSYYIYISSKNRNQSEKIYNFNVILNNAIITNKNQGLNISVDYFSILNTDYNLKDLSFSFVVENPVLVFTNYNINIPNGNYSYQTLLNYLNTNTTINSYIKFEYIKERNSIKFINISQYKIYINPLNSNKILGLNDITTILSGNNYEGSYINLTNYSHIIIKSNNILFEDNTQDNINNNDMSNSSILFMIDKQDIQPFQLISYRNNGGDNYSYNISNRQINNIDIQLYNEIGEFLINITDFYLVLKIVVFDKENNNVSIPFLEDIRFLLMNMTFNNKNKILL